MDSAPTAVLIAFIIFVSGFVQSFTGFGFALIATPLLFLLAEPKPAVGLVIVLSTVILLAMTLIYRKNINKKRALFMSLGGFLGIPLGVYLILIITPESLKLTVGAIIIVLAILLMLNRTYCFKRFIPWHMAAGFFSGLLSSSTSLGGPPSVLFLMSQNVEKLEFLGTVSATGFIIFIVNTAALGSLGIITADTLKIAGISLPGMALGLLLGTQAVKRINNKIFRYITISLVILSAAVIIITTLISG